MVYAFTTYRQWCKDHDIFFTSHNFNLFLEGEDLSFWGTGKIRSQVLNCWYGSEVKSDHIAIGQILFSQNFPHYVINKNTV
jgi:hypothetical protein